MKLRSLLVIPAGAAPLALIGWGAYSFYRVTSAPADAPTVPTTAVKRGDVTFTVSAKGDLQGGNTEMLTAPMTGGREMVITMLRKPGELVQAGDTVAEFDTTEQEFQLREAEADVAEAEQQLARAQAESLAKAEEARYALLQAESELRLAELEARRNPLVATIVARQNTLAVDAARDRVNQVREDLASRQATTEAGVAIQEAALQKAKVRADTARRNIQSMTLKARSDGYVSVQQNTNTDTFMSGMQFPIFQVGDMARAGMAVAQIPDMHNWEVTARIGELDRGHLAVGQKATVTVIALPGKTLTGRIRNIGGTAGPPWDRNFECRIGLENPSPELRPGMSARVVVTTERIQNALWIPSQALFESGERKYVYVQQDGGFVPFDVRLVRRSESQAVIAGLTEGRHVALAAPDQQSKKSGPAGAMQAIPKE